MLDKAVKRSQGSEAHKKSPSAAFLIPVLSTGCSTIMISPTPSSGDMDLGSEPAKGAEIPMQSPLSPVRMLQLQTIPPKVVPISQVELPPPAPLPTPSVTPSPPPDTPS